MTDVTIPEHQAQSNMMLQVMRAQHKETIALLLVSQDQCVNLMGQVAILEMRIAAMVGKVKEEDGA